MPVRLSEIINVKDFGVKGACDARAIFLTLLTKLPLESRPKIRGS
jgi:hypothetical protein